MPTAEPKANFRLIVEIEIGIVCGANYDYKNQYINFLPGECE